MKKIQIRARQFAKAYIRNKGNGKKTAEELYNAKNDNVARNIASTNLIKPIFQREILREMEEQGITGGFLTQEHHKVIRQDKNLPAKNTALDMAYKIRGDYAPDKKIGLNFSIPSGEGLNIALQALLQEVKQLGGDKMPQEKEWPSSKDSVVKQGID